MGFESDGRVLRGFFTLGGLVDAGVQVLISTVVVSTWLADFRFAIVDVGACVKRARKSDRPRR